MDGWWELKVNVNCKCRELNDIDRRHIAKVIEEGYTSGEICHEHGDEEEEEDCEFCGE